MIALAALTSYRAKRWRIITKLKHPLGVNDQAAHHIVLPVLQDVASWESILRTNTLGQIHAHLLRGGPFRSFPGHFERFSGGYYSGRARIRSVILTGRANRGLQTASAGLRNPDPDRGRAVSACRLQSCCKLR